MKDITFTQNLKRWILVLILTGLSTGCTMRLEPAYTTTFSLADVPTQPDIIAAPIQKAPSVAKSFPVLETHSQHSSSQNWPIETDRGLQFTLYSVFFKTGKARLLPEGEQQIKEFVELIEEYDDSRAIAIEGHTDSRGSKAYNKGLSKRRAETVRKALIARGIESDRLIIKGFGEKEPIATNRTKNGRQQNRRVEIILLKN
jgi:outer membrane protein OmpA-like peptidoglycan-associated protein